MFTLHILSTVSLNITYPRLYWPYRTIYPNIFSHFSACFYKQMENSADPDQLAGYIWVQHG